MAICVHGGTSKVRNSHRNLSWSDLWRSSFSPSPARIRSNYTKLFPHLSSRVLNISEDGNPTTCLGNLLQSWWKDFSSYLTGVSLFFSICGLLSYLKELSFFSMPFSYVVEDSSPSSLLQTELTLFPQPLLTCHVLHPPDHLGEHVPLLTAVQ